MYSNDLIKHSPLSVESEYSISGFEKCSVSKSLIGQQSNLYESKVVSSVVYSFSPYAH